MNWAQYRAQQRATSPAQALFDTLAAAVGMCGSDDPAVSLRVSPGVREVLAGFKPDGSAWRFDELPVTVDPDCALAEVTTGGGRTILVEE